jgi:hypothetical protein
VRAADGADHYYWYLPVAKLGQPLSVALSSCCAPSPFSFPTGRPATASLHSQLALLGRSASVSAKTSREGVFLDSPPACCCEVCQSALLTQAPASKQSRHPRQLHPSRTPHPPVRAVVSSQALVIVV